MKALERFDLELYVQKFGAKPLSKPGEWVLDCPLCGKEDKLHVNVRKKNWHCWVCEEYQVRADGRRVPVRGAGGVLALIQLLEGCTKEQAVGIVFNNTPAPDTIDLESLETDFIDPDYLSEQQDTEVRPAVPIPPPPFWQAIDESNYGFLPYIRQRGITMDDVRMYGLVHCVQGRYAGRLIFPVWERRQMVYYQARAMFDGESKFGKRFIKALNPPNHPGMATAAEVVFNLDTARNYPRVAIVEGPVDAIHVGPDAVASFGKKLSAVQILKMKYAGVQAVDLMWDGPSQSEPYGAWPEMLKAAAKLAGIFRDVRVVFIPKGDPGEYTRAENAMFRAHARAAASISRLALL